MATIFKELHPALEALDRERRQYLRKVRIHYPLVIFLPMLAAGLIIMVKGADSLTVVTSLMAAVISAFLGFWIFSSATSKTGSNYKCKLKTLVVSGLLDSFENELYYSANKGISPKLFKRTGLFSMSPDQLTSRNRFLGRVGRTDLQFSHLNAETVNSTSSSTPYYSYFKGLVIIADFQKEFSGRTYLFPDIAEKFIGKVGRSIQSVSGPKGTKLIQMDNPEFEKAFVIYSTDEVEARYILSHSTMEAILKLRKIFGPQVRITFKKSCVAAALPLERPFLHVDTGVSATDEKQFEKLRRDIHIVPRLVETLSLNTRIWSKE